MDSKPRSNWQVCSHLDDEAEFVPGIGRGLPEERSSYARFSIICEMPDDGGPLKARRAHSAISVRRRAARAPFHQLLNCSLGSLQENILTIV